MGGRQSHRNRPLVAATSRRLRQELSARRQELGLSYDTLSARTGMSRQGMHQHLTPPERLGLATAGDERPMNVATLLVLADALECDVDIVLRPRPRRREVLAGQMRGSL